MLVFISGQHSTQSHPEKHYTPGLSTTLCNWTSSQTDPRQSGYIQMKSGGAAAWVCHSVVRGCDMLGTFAVMLTACGLKITVHI